MLVSSFPSSFAELGQALVARGLRVRMMSSSLLTGQKYIEMDFLPQDPPRLVGVKAPYYELPTTPTPMEKLGEKGEQLVAKLAELPIDQMLEDVRLALQSLRSILESEDLKGAISGGRRATNAVPPTLEEARATLAEARKALDTVAGEVRETASTARDTLREARHALDRAERTLARLEETASGADEARVAAVQAIEELRQTLRGRSKTSSPSRTRSPWPSSTSSGSSSWARRKPPCSSGRPPIPRPTISISKAAISGTRGPGRA